MKIVIYEEENGQASCVNDEKWNFSTIMATNIILLFFVLKYYVTFNILLIVNHSNDPEIFVEPIHYFDLSTIVIRTSEIRT